MKFFEYFCLEDVYCKNQAWLTLSKRFHSSLIRRKCERNFRNFLVGPFLFMPGGRRKREGAPPATLLVSDVHGNDLSSETHTHTDIAAAAASCQEEDWCVGFQQPVWTYKNTPGARAPPTKKTPHISCTSSKGHMWTQDLFINGELQS